MNKPAIPPVCESVYLHSCFLFSLPHSPLVSISCLSHELSFLIRLISHEQWIDALQSLRLAWRIGGGGVASMRLIDGGLSQLTEEVKPLLRVHIGPRRDPTG